MAEIGLFRRYLKKPHTPANTPTCRDILPPLGWLSSRPARWTRSDGSRPQKPVFLRLISIGMQPEPKSLFSRRNLLTLVFSSC